MIILFVGFANSEKTHYRTFVTHILFEMIMRPSKAE